MHPETKTSDERVPVEREENRKFRGFAIVFTVGYASAATAAEPWFPIILHNDEVRVVGKGMKIDECTKKQLEPEQKAKGAMVRCSKMTQKVRAESKDDTLDRAYQLTWVADYAAFTEATSLKQCKKE